MLSEQADCDIHKQWCAMYSMRDYALADYARKARPDQVLVACLGRDNGLYRRDTSALHARLAAAGQRFGFRTHLDIQAARPALMQLEPPQAEMSHLIVVEDAPFEAAVVERLERLLRLLQWNSASVAFAYASERDMYASERLVEASKQRTGNRLNFLFPDTVAGDLRFVSDHKIIDNAVCDTVRVKFTPVVIEAATALPDPLRAYFEAASAVYESERMYLRAPSDGYIAARHGAGFFITATRTTKVGLNLDRISFVHGFDRATNALSYSGTFLPSSDAVEAAIVFAQSRHIDFLLHTHASKLFTRNPAFAGRVLVPQLPYGEPALGDALNTALAAVGDGFVIMEEHGDLFAGTGSAAGFLAGVRQRCDEARRALATT